VRGVEGYLTLRATKSAVASKRVNQEDARPVRDQCGRMRRSKIEPIMMGSSRILLAGSILLLASGCDTAGSSGQSVTASIDTQTDEATASGHPRGDRESLGDPLFPIVRVETNLGVLRVQLDLEQAPITGKNFLWYANNGHYDKTIFHQLVPGYMALGGGYTEKFEEKPTQFWIRNEAYNGLKNLKGTIAMARQPDQADSSTCQFFFNLVDNPHLDHQSRNSPAEYGYCVFGRVIEGGELLDKMNRLAVSDQGAFTSVPIPAVVIQSIRLEN